LIIIRLWHKSLISVLPREQLVAQWRECSAIAGSIQTKGTPNHILVNKVLDYDFDHFITYSKLIRDEMTSRNYRTMNSVWDKIVSLKPDWNEVSFDNLYRGWMDSEYLTICYYNLLEKYRCGGIREEDWQKIFNLFSNYFLE
jgi:uncharacterized protein (TIGR02328 family)